jgi:predicted hotdog family 3-hydroxylacyl-ACP dehydratase
MADLDLQEFPPVAELVPHEPPMLLVEQLVEWSEQAALVRATIRAGSPFVCDERMPATILLEYMAQAIAVANGMAGRRRGKPANEVGLLLGTRELELCVDELAVGDVLELRVICEYTDDKLARYACTTERAGELLARATINVMVGSAAELRA